MWPLLIVSSLVAGVGGWLLLRSMGQEQAQTDDPPEPPEPDGEPVAASFEEAKAMYGQSGKPVYLGYATGNLEVCSR